MTITAENLTKGTVVRFQPSILRSTKLTVRLTARADVREATEGGSVYAIFFGYRVRPNNYDVSFGHRKVYCVNTARMEIVREA